MSEFDFLKPKFENIPDRLKEQPWAVWIAEPRANRPGKFDKAPRNPLTGVRIGTDKPHLFGTYDQARSAYETSNGRYTGVGVLLTGNGIIGVDIDEVKATMLDRPTIKDWIHAAANDGAYCEVSPSGTGFRLFMLGDPLPKGVKRKHGHLEIYDDVRFLTVTGHQIKWGNDNA